MDIWFPAALQTLFENTGYSYYSAALKGPMGLQFKVQSLQTFTFQALKIGLIGVLSFFWKSFTRSNTSFRPQNSAWDKATYMWSCTYVLIPVCVVIFLMGLEMDEMH